jgi:hypothetical protein
VTPQSKQICGKCPSVIGSKGAKGLCHKCYERGRYKQNPVRGAEINARSYQKNKPNVKRQQAEWRAKNKAKIQEDGRKYRLKNKDRLDRYFAAWRLKNKDKMHDTHLRRQFGMSRKDFDKMLSEQGSVCAICSNPQRSRGKKNLAVDHDKETGIVRRLLCDKCNMALGLMDHNPGIAVRIALYLMQHGKQL